MPSTKKKTTVKKKTSTKKKKKNKELYLDEKKKRFIMWVVVVSLGVLVTMSTYAWLSTSLNVKIENFKMSVARNSGLSISLDGVNFGKSVEVSEDTLITNLGRLYPNNISQWAGNGMVPVSSPGLTSPNKEHFDFYGSAGVKYRNRKKDIGYVTTYLMDESTRNKFNYFLAFDIFLKNVTGSPVADNLYLEDSSFFEMDYDAETAATLGEDFQEMVGLVNSARIGFVKIGSVSSKADVNTIQNVHCNGGCEGYIWEPNSTLHGDLSIERALHYGINLVDGERFPSYAWIKAGGPIETRNAVSGSANMDFSYFSLQNTIKELPVVLFSVPDGITKVRVYVWLEGQDIDSLETDSEGARVSISIDLSKDTLGYTAFND